MKIATYHVKKALLTYWTASSIGSTDIYDILSAPYVSKFSNITLATARRLLAQDMVRTEIVQRLEIEQPPEPEPKKPPEDPGALPWV